MSQSVLIWADHHNGQDIARIFNSGLSKYLLPPSDVCESGLLLNTHNPQGHHTILNIYTQIGDHWKMSTLSTMPGNCFIH